LWPGSTNRAGYGTLKIGGRTVLAHRWTYEQEVGPLAPGAVLHHLCGTKRCVEPSHLEPLAAAEHNARTQREKTHCPHGHAYTPENTIRWADGKRRCRTCDQARDRGYDAWRRAHLAERAAYLREWRKRKRAGNAET
jgi:hypothetical protein